MAEKNWKLTVAERRQKKKAVVQQFFSYAWLENGGFEQIKAAVLLSLKGKTTTTR